MSERPAAYRTRRNTLKDGSISEKAFSQQVVDFARLHGWKVQRHWSEQFSPSGWPDLTFARPADWAGDGCRLLFAELKSARGTVSGEQWDWINALLGAGTPVKVWYPSDWPEIEHVLGGHEE